MAEQEPPVHDIWSSCATLTDPSSPNARHHWLDMIVMAICAVICGVEGWEDLAEYGRVQASWFAALLEFPHGIPSHAIFRQVLARLAPEELTPCCLTWTQALHEATDGE